MRPALLVLLLMVLPGCVQTGSEDGTPGPGTQSPDAPAITPSSTTGDEGAGDWLAAWEDVPVLAEWQRAGCDPDRSAQPAGNAPPPAPFDGSVADLVRELEDAFSVDVTDGSLAPGSLVAHVPTPDGTDTFSVPRVSPALEWRLSHAWPASSLALAWPRVNATLGELGMPPPTQRLSSTESEAGYTLQLAWPGTSGLRQLDAEVSQHGDGILSRGILSLWPNGGQWPDGIDNASLEQVAVDFVACQVGEGYQVAYGWSIPATAHGSVARWMTLRLPTPGHHCGGPSYDVGVDIATKVVLAHRPGQPCI